MPFGQLGKPGRLGLGACSPLYLPETNALLSRLDLAPDGDVIWAANALIGKIKDLDNWAKLDILGLPLALGLAQSDTRNWIADANNLTAVNSPTLSGVGWTSDGATSYLDTGLAANAAANYSQDSAFVGSITITDLADNAYLDVGTSSSIEYINARNASDLMVVRANYSGGSAQTADMGGSSIGFFYWNRTTSTDFTMGRNAQTPAAKSVATTGVSAGTFTMCKSGTYSLRACSGIVVGSALNDPQAFGAAIVTYYADAFGVDLTA